MYIILLKFSDRKDQAANFMEGHKNWIAQGFSDNIFLLVGSIKPSQGGAIVAHNCTLTELTARVDQDPFVAENIVTAEVIEVDPARTDERLNFLKP